MFKKAKPTFLMSSGRMGAPSARKPMMSIEDRLARATGSYKTGKKAGAGKPKKKVVKNGGPMKTGKMKGTINSFRTAKAPKMPSRGRKDAKHSNFFSGKGIRLTSATHSPQSTRSAARPRG